MSVSINIKGLPQTRSFLDQKKKNIETHTQLGLTKAALHVQNEVKLSIAGRKAETRSVDTGRFLNSISKEISKFNASIYSLLEYAKFLEFGTSKIKARRHFQNTKFRESNNVTKILESEIKSI